MEHDLYEVLTTLRDVLCDFDRRIKYLESASQHLSGEDEESKILGNQLDYMTQQQLESAAVAASLSQTHNRLIQTFLLGIKPVCSEIL